MLLVSALVFSGFNSTAQIKEITSVPSPDVANLGTFGNVPIGHFTGTPDISVPLYTLKAGAFTLPLTARYHVNNVKPHNPPSTLGIGWSLFAGGYIARTIKGVPDEKIEDTDSVGYMYNFDKLKQIDESQDKTLAMRNIVTLSTDNNSHKKWFELSADEFVFNFNGYSGSFFLDKNGEWKVTSSTPIKIEFDKNNGFRKINSFRDKLDIIMYLIIRFS